MDINEVLNKLKLRFSSGNEIPITSARITIEEYEVIKQTIFNSNEKINEK